VLTENKKLRRKQYRPSLPRGQQQLKCVVRHDRPLPTSFVFTFTYLVCVHCYLPRLFTYLVCVHSYLPRLCSLLLLHTSFVFQRCRCSGNSVAGLTASSCFGSGSSTESMSSTAITIDDAVRPTDHTHLINAEIKIKKSINKCKDVGKIQQN